MERGSSGYGYGKVQIVTGDTWEGDTVDERGLEKEADQGDCRTAVHYLDGMDDDRLCSDLCHSIGKYWYHSWGRAGVGTYAVGLGRAGERSVNGNTYLTRLSILDAVDY